MKKNRRSSRGMRLALLLLVSALCLTLFACLPTTPTPTPDPSVPSDPVDPEKLTVTFQAQNGEAQSTVNVTKGEKVQKPTDPTKTGYTFVGWTLDGVAYDFNTAVTGDITLVAEWKINTYTVTFTNGDASSTETVEYGAKVNKPADPEKMGYTFNGWTLNGVAYDFNTAVTGNITLVAEWKINTYTVTFTNGDAISTETVEHNAKVNKPTDPTKAGYTFVGWTLNGVAYDFNTAVTGNITLVAEWKINTYTVTFDAANGTDKVTENINHGNTVNKPANPKKVGYTFGGWMLDGVLYDFSKQATSDMTLIAKWIANPCNITFDSQNGEASTSVSVNKGETVPKPADPEKVGYTFVGWYLDGVAYDFNTAVAGDITLVAEWKINTYTVTFDAKNDTEATKQTVNYGATVSKPAAPEKVGYTFMGWTLNGVAYDFNTAITGNITLTAEWQINTYTVTFTNDGTSTTETVEYGAKVNKPSDPTKTGYTFVGWNLDGTAYNFDVAVTGNITLVAEWKINTYTVTFTNDDTSTTETVEHGAKVNKPTDPTKTGYTFVGWNLDGVAHDFNTAITGNVTLTAEWKINTYTVTFTNDGTSTTETVEYGAKVNKPTDPTKTGYTFVGWTLDGTAYDFNSAITGDITLVAEWKINTYTVTFTNGDASSTETVEYGAKVNKPADPEKIGYTFVGWNLDGVAYDFNTAVTGDITLTAEWKINTYAVTFDAQNGSTPTTVTVEHGGRVSKPADPTKAGYTFLGWYIGDKQYSFRTQVVSDLTITAKWEGVAYTITFDTNGGDAMESLVVTQGTVLSELPVPTKNGYTYTGWKHNGVAVSYPFTVSGDMTLTTSWELVTYKISYVMNGGGTIGSRPTSFTIESPTIYLPYGNRANYDFLGWTWEGQDTPETNVTIPKGSTGDRTYTAHFKYQSYEITFITGNTKKTVTLNKGAVPSYGGEVPNQGEMQFVMWYPTLKTVSADATYTAIYTDVITPDLFLSMMKGEYGYSQKQYTTTVNLWRDMNAMAEIYPLVLQQHEYPQPGVAEVVVNHIKGMISDKCLFPFDLKPNWNNGMTAAVFAMIKDTPSIWNLLSASDIERMDTMLLAIAYVESLGTSTYNDYRTGPSLTGNYRKTWNPNYRLGNVTGMAFLPYYFGNGDINVGAAWLNEKIRTFNEAEYERMIHTFSVYGWEEAYACWTTVGVTAGNGGVSTSTAKQLLVYGGDVISLNTNGSGLQGSTGVGVNNGGRDYTYTGYFGKAYTLYQPEMILRDLAYYNYSGGVIKSDFYYDVGNGTEKLAGISDGTKSPLEGKIGMMLEFASGNRSSASYCNDDFLITSLMFSAASHLPRYETIGNVRTVKTENGKIAYLYNVSTETELWEMVQNGNEDFIYKVVHGYDNIASGSYGSNVTSSTNANNIGSGFHMMRALWENGFLKKPAAHGGLPFLPAL